jgi:tetratricopeptide (TPR) repeat protein
MMKKGVCFFLVCVFCQAYLIAQTNFKDTYLELLQSGRFDDLKILLENWENSEPQNPEMFIGYFNYYVNKSAEVRMSTYVENGRHFFGPKKYYSHGDVYDGINYLDKALGCAPNRLDIYWGKIEILMEIGDYTQAGETLYNLIGLSPEYNNNWLLGNGRTVQNGEQYFLNYINRYYDRMLYADMPGVRDIIKRCAEKQIEIYPHSIYGYNILAMYHMMVEETEAALNQLLLAETINDSDCTILINIGRLYGEMGNREKSKEYLSKVSGIGNAEERRRAQYYIDQFGL